MAKSSPAKRPRPPWSASCTKNLASPPASTASLSDTNTNIPAASRILLIFYRVLDFDGVPQNLDFEQICWELAERLPDYDFLEGDKRFIGQFAGLPANTISPPEA